MKSHILPIILLVFNVVFSSETFPTAIGNCTLHLYNEQTLKNQNLQKLIMNELYDLTIEYGKVTMDILDVYITNNSAEFHKLAKGPVPEWGAAVARPNPDRIVIKGPGLSNMSYPRLKDILSHELNHIFLFRKRGNTFVPRWFSEGFATDWADEFDLQKKILISSALWENRIFSLETLRHFNQFHRIHARLAYAQSAAAIEAMRYYYSENIISQLLNELENESDFDSLFSRLTKDDGPEFLIKYESFLNENYRWMFLLKTSNMLFVFMPLLLIAGYFIKRRKGKILLQKWQEEEALLDEDNETN